MHRARIDIFNVYACESFIVDTWRGSFKRICDREGISRSDKVRDLIEEYVRLHGPGNPITTLDVLMKLGKPYRAGVCLDCGGKATHEGIINGISVYLCSRDFTKRRQHLQGWRVMKK